MVVFGANISTFPSVLTNQKAYVVYSAPNVTLLESFNFTAVCGGMVESGERVQGLESEA